MIEELDLHIPISLFCIVILFDFTTPYQYEALADYCVLLIFNIKSYPWNILNSL
jgi:hypothetical protein